MSTIYWLLYNVKFLKEKKKEEAWQRSREGRHGENEILLSRGEEKEEMAFREKTEEKEEKNGIMSLSCGGEGKKKEAEGEMSLRLKTSPIREKEGKSHLSSSLSTLRREENGRLCFSSVKEGRKEEHTSHLPPSSCKLTSLASPHLDLFSISSSSSQRRGSGCGRWHLSIQQPHWW